MTEVTELTIGGPIVEFGGGGAAEENEEGQIMSKPGANVLLGAAVVLSIATGISGCQTEAGELVATQAGNDEHVLMFHPILQTAAHEKSRKPGHDRRSDPHKPFKIVITISSDGKTSHVHQNGETVNQNGEDDELRPLHPVHCTVDSVMISVDGGSFKKILGGSGFSVEHCL